MAKADLDSDGMVNLFKWWYARRTRFPWLFVMARVALGVAATSVGSD